MRTSLLAALTLLSLPAAAQIPAGQNLLVVPGAEAPTTPSWSIGSSPNQPGCNSTNNWAVSSGGGITARTGNGLFFPGCATAPGGTYSISQAVDVSADAADIDNNIAVYTFDGFYSNRNEAIPDSISFQIIFYDTSSFIGGFIVTRGGLEFSSSASGTDGQQSPWTYIDSTMTLPPTTRYVEVVIEAKHISGTNVDVYFDDLRLAKGVVALSLGLARFSAAAAPDGAVSLQWEDSRAAENARYAAQWSTDGKAWTTIASLNASRIASYSCLHRTPARGTNHYRIAAKGLDGSLEYSATRTVRLGNEAATRHTASAYPVPAAGTVTVRGLGAGLAGTTAVLMNAQGRTVRTLALGAGPTATVSLDGCVAGVYTLRLADGQVLRVVKE